MPTKENPFFNFLIGVVYFLFFTNTNEVFYFVEKQILFDLKVESKHNFKNDN